MEPDFTRYSTQQAAGLSPDMHYRWGIRAFQVFTLLLCVHAGQAFAWGGYGHRVIGEIAALHLSKTATHEVYALLAGEPEPTLAGVAAWADTVRTRGTAARHYVNIDPESCDYDPSRDCPRGTCLPSALNHAIAVLEDTGAPHAERAAALKWVVHLVGDAHAPLHAGLREDRGGNAYQLRWENRGTNLHALWDSGLLKSITTGSAKAYAAALTRTVPSFSPAGVDVWVEEGCRIVRRAGFYPNRNPGPTYLATWRPTLDERLALAGMRLSALLNQTLDP